MKNILLLACLIVLGCQPPQAPKETSFEQLANLADQYANDALQKGNLNAIGIAIYRNGKTHHNYFGELKKNTGNPPDDHTLFEIASISKVFLGSLTAQAVLEDKINLNDDIRKYLNGDYPNLEFEGTPITIRDLVTHTLGFDTPTKLREVYNNIAEGYYESRTLDYNIENLLDELKKVELDKKPGTFYAYNNVGSELAAHILEQVNRRPYKEQLQTIFDELNMQNTYLQEFDKHLDHLAKGYDKANNLAPVDKNPLLGGSAGIITTLPDLMKFMKFQLQSDNPLIKEATRILFEDKDDNVMGYLWQDMGVAEEEGFYYSKTGDTNGVKSGILICPDIDYGQIVIVNNQSEAANKDWGTLFNQIETDLIKYPRINLKSLLKANFIKDKKKTTAKFNQLKKQDTAYFNTDLIWTLNTIGYDLLYTEKKIQQAIQFFEFAITKDPENANLYDSLGEAYFIAEDYKNALISYKKSLELNPNNENAREYIDRINQL